MKAGRTTRLLVPLALLAGAALAVPAGGATPAAAAPFVCSAMCAGGEYHPITQPLRIFDTRPVDQNGTGPINDVAPGGRKPMAAPPGTAKFDVDLLGLTNPGYRNPWLGGTQVDAASDVLAVVASVTVVNPTQGGFLKAYAAGEAEPNASLLNFAAGRNVSNLAILRPNSSGMLTIALRGGATGGAADVVIDVFGWFSTSTYNVDDTLAPNTPYGARLLTIPPARLQDTRLGAGAVGTRSTLHVPIRGATQLGTSTVVVPNDPSVVGVVLNVTGVTPTVSTFLSAVPNDPAGTPPSTSNVNLLKGEVKANLVIVPVNPTTGDVWIYNHNGNTHVVVDVVGYLQTVDETTPTRAGRVVPLTTPFRAFDTRSPLFGSVPLGPRQAEDWSFAAFAASVNIGGVSVGNQSALIGNLTNAALGRATPSAPISSFLTVYPSPGGTGSPPTVSNLNSIDTTFGTGGFPVPNMALVRWNPANTTVRVYNHAGYADYLLDVSAVVLAD